MAREGDEGEAGCMGRRKKRPRQDGSDVESDELVDDELEGESQLSVATSRRPRYKNAEQEQYVMLQERILEKNKLIVNMQTTAKGIEDTKRVLERMSKSKSYTNLRPELQNTLEFNITLEQIENTLQKLMGGMESLGMASSQDLTAHLERCHATHKECDDMAGHFGTAAESAKTALKKFTGERLKLARSSKHNKHAMEPYKDKGLPAGIKKALQDVLTESEFSETMMETSCFTEFEDLVSGPMYVTGIGAESFDILVNMLKNHEALSQCCIT